MGGKTRGGCQTRGNEVGFLPWNTRQAVPARSQGCGAPRQPPMELQARLPESHRPLSPAFLRASSVSLCTRYSL